MKTETNGFRVMVGIKKGSGTFNYIIGTPEQAEQLGEEMLEKGNLLFKQQNLFVTIEPCCVSKCANSYCNKLTEEDYCLRCEDLMFDARHDAQEELNDYEVCCNGY